MLKFYLTTVVIYAIIISSMAKMFRNAVKENGWLDEEKKSTESKFTMLFCLSAVPILRILVIICIYMMAMHGPDDNFWKKND